MPAYLLPYPILGPIVEAPRVQAACEGCAFITMCRTRTGTTYRVQTIRPVNPVPCRLVPKMIMCDATHEPNLEGARTAPAKKLGTWVVDANIFMEAFKGNEACKRVLLASGVKAHFVTSRRVREELHYNYEFPADVEVVSAGEIQDAFRAMAATNAAAGKQASDADLSLAQLLLLHDYAGIITYDPDLFRIHPQSWVKKQTGRDVRVLSPEQFLAKLS